MYKMKTPQVVPMSRLNSASLIKANYKIVSEISPKK